MLDSISAARIGAPRQNSNGLTIIEFNFSPEDPVFAGHFPGYPILPGVFQLEMVRYGAAAALDCRLAVREIRKAKFSRPIQPGQTLNMELKLTEGGQLIRARATFSVGDQPAGETVVYLCRSE